MSGMTRDLFRLRSIPGAALLERSLPARPDQARWPHVAGYGLAGAAEPEHENVSEMGA